ncbi:unnamed protein product [Clonostachys rhizophaga]|uniref:Uncharacterized protein n=1 Tax=Clonostachys rhizophaga TaxID=160324 RepID=A0A9N9VIF9_9HYPO|nr:unnamed protein product [Clonostachys rhizophaga]
MQQHPPGPRISAGPEMTMQLDGVEYILIPNDVNFFLNVDSSSPVPFLLYALYLYQVVTSDSLSDFFLDLLMRDDVYQRKFASRLVLLMPGFESGFVTWGVDHHECVPGDQKVASGPYVFFQQRVWQPWRVYHDHKATFMCTFKANPKKFGR